MPAISVIVPTRRRPALLSRAVKSILAQTVTDFEIVVVDNNPAAFRVAAVPAHMAWLRDKRVRLVEDATPNNPAALRNLGLAIARGDWVTYLDDDDEFRPGKVEQQWREADASRLALGVCQLRFHVPLRRRKRGRKLREIGGDDLLLCFPGMPTVFHRRAPAVRFDATLDAGEDMHYFQRLVRHFELSRVFNVPEPLVDVHVQPDAHANHNAEGSWKATEAILRDFGTSYSAAARRVFCLQARLGYCKLQPGRFGEMLGAAAELVRERHVRDARLILNAFLFKMAWARRWLVS
jgi:glycosyltransferase involved in cell wall biosynthesis